MMIPLPLQGPVTRKEYDRILADIRQRHAWLGTAFLEPVPGHLPVVAKLAADLDRAFPNEVLTSMFENSLIAGDEHGQLSIAYSNSDLRNGQMRVLQKLHARAVGWAAKRCQVCGNPAERSPHLCPDHSDFIGLFADDNQRPLDDASPGDSSANNLLDYAFGGHVIGPPEALLREPSTDAGAIERASAKPQPIVVRLFDPAHLVTFKETAKSADAESRTRIQNLAKRLEATDAHRPLAILPADWRVRLESLAEEFPNFDPYFQFLIGQCALQQLGDNRLALPPVLFNGPPGIGKTELVGELSALFGNSALTIDMATAQSGSAISGSSTFWSNSRHGQFFETLVFGPTANPFVILEELDKADEDARFDPKSGLLLLLEQRTASAFVDLSVPEVPLDASHVLWVALSNDRSRIDAPLLSRFVSFDIPPPDRAQTARIAQGIYRRLVSQRAWGTYFAPELQPALAKVLGEVSPREIRIRLERAFGQAALAGRRELTKEDLDAASRRDDRPIGFVHG